MIKALENRISRNSFIDYIQACRNNQELCLKTLESTNGLIDLINYDEYINKPLHILEKALFTDIELDYISWYLYEDVEKTIFDSKTHEIIFEIKTDGDLWDYLNSEDVVKANNKKKKTKKQNTFSEDNIFRWIFD